MTNVGEEIAAHRKDDREPLRALSDLVDRARSVESLDIEIVDGDDPLEELRELIERARRQQRGAGGEALQRLEEKIDAAHKLPTPRPYFQPDGDPLDVLRARMRGELLEPGADDESSREAGPDTGGKTSAAEAADGVSPSRRQQRLGQALEQSLRKRPLPGPLRAEVAARIAAMMEGGNVSGLQELWQLVVFGERDLGSEDEAD